MDAVAAGLGADIDDGVAGAGRLGGEDAVGGGDADRHGVDEWVAVIGGVEVHLAADRGDADAIAVAADAADHAVHDVFRAGVRGRAEAQRVEVGDGAGAHGEDVAEDAADAGRGALVGLDEARVVVGLHLEHGGEALADVHHAGVLAGALDDPGGLRRQLAQPDAGGFVGAVLRPHHAEQAEFGAGGQAAEDGERAVVLLRGEAELGGELGGVFGGKERGACCLVGVGHARFLGGARCGGKRRVPVGGRIRTVEASPDAPFAGGDGQQLLVAAQEAPSAGRAGRARGRGAWVSGAWKTPVRPNPGWAAPGRRLQRREETEAPGEGDDPQAAEAGGAATGAADPVLQRADCRGRVGAGEGAEQAFPEARLGEAAEVAAMASALPKAIGKVSRRSRRRRSRRWRPCACGRRARAAGAVLDQDKGGGVRSTSCRKGAASGGVRCNRGGAGEIGECMAGLSCRPNIRT